MPMCKCDLRLELLDVTRRHPTAHNVRCFGPGPPLSPRFPKLPGSRALGSGVRPDCRNRESRESKVRSQVADRSPPPCSTSQLTTPNLHPSAPLSSVLCLHPPALLPESLLCPPPFPPHSLPRCSLFTCSLTPSTFYSPPPPPSSLPPSSSSPRSYLISIARLSRSAACGALRAPDVDQQHQQRQRRQRHQDGPGLPRGA